MLYELLQDARSLANGMFGLLPLGLRVHQIIPGTPTWNSQSDAFFLGGLLTVVVNSMMVAAVATVSPVVEIVIGKRINGRGSRIS